MRSEVPPSLVQRDPVHRLFAAAISKGVQVSAPFGNVKYALEVFGALEDFGPNKEGGLTADG